MVSPMLTERRVFHPWLLVLVSGVIHENSGEELSNSNTINSSMINTVRDFLDNFLRDYENYESVGRSRPEDACDPSPCDESALCVRLGDLSFRCVCPAGYWEVREEARRYCWFWNTSLLIYKSKILVCVNRRRSHGPRILNIECTKDL